MGEAPADIAEIVLRWDSKPGRTYAVDRTSDPGAEWEELDDGVTATGESTEYCDAALPEPGPRILLYRVRGLE